MTIPTSHFSTMEQLLPPPATGSQAHASAAKEMSHTDGSPQKQSFEDHLADHTNKNDAAAEKKQAGQSPIETPPTDKGTHHARNEPADQRPGHTSAPTEDVNSQSFGIHMTQRTTPEHGTAIASPLLQEVLGQNQSPARGTEQGTGADDHLGPVSTVDTPDTAAALSLSIAAQSPNGHTPLTETLASPQASALPLPQPPAQGANSPVSPGLSAAVMTPTQPAVSDTPPLASPHFKPDGNQNNTSQPQFVTMTASSPFKTHGQHTPDAPNGASLPHQAATGSASTPPSVVSDDKAAVISHPAAAPADQQRLKITTATAPTAPNMAQQPDLAVPLAMAAAPKGLQLAGLKQGSNAAKAENLATPAQLNDAPAGLKDTFSTKAAIAQSVAAEQTNAARQNVAAETITAQRVTTPTPGSSAHLPHAQGGISSSQPQALPTLPADFAAHLLANNSDPVAVLPSGHGTDTAQSQNVGLMRIAAASKSPIHLPVADQIAVSLTRSLQDGQNEFRLRLHPAELGRVDVKLDITADGRIQAVLATDNEKTLNLLMRDQSTLERALQNAGLQTGQGSLNFSLQQGDEKGQDGHWSQPNNTFSTNANNDDHAALSPALIHEQINMMIADGNVDIRI